MKTTLSSAADEAAARIKFGEPAGLAIHITAKKHDVSRHALARFLGKRGAAAKAAKKKNPNQLSLF